MHFKYSGLVVFIYLFVCLFLFIYQQLFVQSIMLSHTLCIKQKPAGVEYLSVQTQLSKLTKPGKTDIQRCSESNLPRKTKQRLFLYCFLFRNWKSFCIIAIANTGQTKQQILSPAALNLAVLYQAFCTDSNMNLFLSICTTAFLKSAYQHSC